MNKKVPVWVLALTIFIGINLALLFGGLVRHVQMNGRLQQYGKLGEVTKAVSEFPLLVKKAFDELNTKTPLILKNRFPNIDGFRKNGVLQKGAADDNGYLFLSAYDNAKKQSTVKLIRIRDQKVVHEWIPNIQELRKKHNAESSLFKVDNLVPSRFLLRHPLLFDDGSIIFNTGYYVSLFKIDVCSKFEWTNSSKFHHSIERDADGNLWIPSYINPPSYDKHIFNNYRDDSITKFSPEGEILLKRSASKILERNGYRGLLFGTGVYERDAVHLNDIQPALYSTKYWEKGDILVSLRNISTVFLYRPSTDKVLWLKTGPWLSQHDADFIDESKISIFGNNTLRGTKNIYLQHNDIFVFDFADGSISRPYSEVLKNNDVRTRAQGLQEILENGDAFVEETGDGRILRLSREGIVWEFTVKIDDDRAGRTYWSRYLTEEQVGSIISVLEKSNCP